MLHIIVAAISRKDWFSDRRVRIGERLLESILNMRFDLSLNGEAQLLRQAATVDNQLITQLAQALDFLHRSGIVAFRVRAKAAGADDQSARACAGTQLLERKLGELFDFEHIAAVKVQ